MMHSVDKIGGKGPGCGGILGCWISMHIDPLFITAGRIRLTIFCQFCAIQSCIAPCFAVLCCAIYKTKGWFGGLQKLCGNSGG